MTNNTGYIFDIDGVFLQGANAITKNGINIAGEAYKLVRSKNLPHIFVTNASGLPENKSSKLNKVLNLDEHTKIEPDHIIMAQTPAQKLFEKSGELSGKYRLVLLKCQSQGQSGSLYKTAQHTNKSAVRCYVRYLKM